MKKILAILMAVLMLASVALCGGAVAFADDTVEIHYAYWASMDDYYEQCKADFEASHPGITIVLEHTSWGEYWTKLEAAATGGSVADVFHMNGVNINKYADGGVLLPLDEYIAGSEIDLANYPEAMNEMYNYDGTQYGIAMDYDTIGLWYNKALFDKAGVAYPTSDWTWDDLTAAAAAITGIEDGVYGISAAYDEQSGFYNTVFAEGGWFVDGENFGFNEPGTRAGIQCWIDLMEAGYSPSEASVEENAAYLQFMAGKLGMIFSGDWMVQYYSSEDSSVADVCDVVELPLMSTGKRASVIHGKANCISVATEHPDEAWAWVEYLSGPEAMQRLGEMGIAIPSYLEYSSLFFDANPQYNMGIYADAAANYSYVYPASAFNAEWGDIMWNELVRAFNLEISVDEACDNIMEQLG